MRIHLALSVALLVACSGPSADQACGELFKDIGSGNSSCTAQQPSGDFAMARERFTFTTNKSRSGVVVMRFDSPDEAIRARDRAAGLSAFGTKKIVVLTERSATPDELEAIRKRIDSW